MNNRMGFLLLCKDVFVVKLFFLFVIRYNREVYWFNGYSIEWFGCDFGWRYDVVFLGSNFIFIVFFFN